MRVLSDFRCFLSDPARLMEGCAHSVSLRDTLLRLHRTYFGRALPQESAAEPILELGPAQRLYPAGNESRLLHPIDIPSRGCSAK